MNLEETVRYFNKNVNRISPRPGSAIGRKVEDRHSQKSFRKVHEILCELREGKRDVEDFWMGFHGRLIYSGISPVEE